MATAELQEEVITQPQMTKPTSEELAAQVRIAKQRYMSIPKSGVPVAVEAYPVEDGIALRTFEDKQAEWQWLRDKDFDDQYQSFELVNMTSYLELIATQEAEIRGYRDRLSAALRCMGKSSRKRWDNMVAAVRHFGRRRKKDSEAA